MNQEFFESLQRLTPLQDKILLVIGTAVAGTVTLGNLSAIFGLIVAGLTALTLIPRVILAWRDMIRKLREGEQHNTEEGPEGE